MKSNTASKIKTFTKNHQIGMALIISALLFLATIALNPKSLNPVAFGSILSLTSMLLIAAAGQTLVIISDGIDMSVGATMSMTALITVAVMQGKDSIGLMFAAMAACLVVGAVIGLCNGIGSVRAGLPPMVVTLYISNTVTRLQYVFTGGTPEYTSVPDWLSHPLQRRCERARGVLRHAGGRKDRRAVCAFRLRRVRHCRPEHRHPQHLYQPAQAAGDRPQRGH